MATLGLVASSSSCKGYFDVEPSNSVSTNRVLKERSLLQPSIGGLYDGLQGGVSNSEYYAQSFLIMGDVRGDDMQCPTVGSRGNNYYKMDYTRSDVTGPWYEVYSIIRRANRLLQMCDNLQKNATAEQQKEIAQARAHARAVRALCNFDLCRVYAGLTPSPTMGAYQGYLLSQAYQTMKLSPGVAPSKNAMTSSSKT